MIGRGRFCLIWLWLACPGLSWSAERYAAMFADGRRTEEAEVREWCEPAAQPKIGGRGLFDDSAPVRWIIDRSMSPAPRPSTYVEFAGGDRIAAEVISFDDGQGNPYEMRLPHLVVKPAFEFLPPEVNSIPELHVITDWVQRIVWEHSGADEYRPGTVWLRSGASMTFRSLRWMSNGLTILTGEGLKEIPFSELSELHLPRLNPWNSYFEQLAVLSPGARSRLIQLDTNDGSRWTVSVERFQPRHYGDRNRPEQWYQLVQPAWSLDPVWLRYRTIRAWKFFTAHEIPLPGFALVNTRHEAVFGSGWDWQLDQSARREQLRSLDQEYGWGFGVFGTSELTFEYPEIATHFRTGFGLDRAAGSGGCVNLEVIDGTGQSVIRQENLIGSAVVGQVNWTRLPSEANRQSRLSLQTQMAHESRPEGADPFDIRDFFNWYEPELRLDQAALEAEVRARAGLRHGGFSGWKLSNRDLQSLRVENLLDNFDQRDPQFRRLIRSVDRFYTLSRKVTVGPRDRWLAIAASRPAENSSSTSIQVRINGRVYADFELPIRYSVIDPEPMLVPVSEFQGRTVTVDAVVYPKDEKSWVDWRGFSTGVDRPGLRTIFEDDENIVAELHREGGQIELDADNPYSGAQSLKVTPGAGRNSKIPGLQALISESPQLGQYRFVVFAWKKKTGSRIQIQFANQGLLGEEADFSPGDRLAAFQRQGLRRTQNLDERGQRYRYCFEKGVTTMIAPAPLWLSGDLPADWQLVHRDLFSDFGIMSLTGLSLKCVDGEAAWFDHIYLARTHEDLQFAFSWLVNPQPESPKPNEAGHLWIARREDYAAEISRVAPLFSSQEIPHGLVRQIEHQGQTDVLKTHANDQDKPLILRAGVELPNDPPKMLDLHVTHYPNCDWQLVIKAKGEILMSQLIDEKLTTPQRGWATVQVDLSRLAGQKVLLEVLNQSNNWQNESAYWKRIDLVEK